MMKLNENLIRLRAGKESTTYQNYEYGLRLPLLPTLIALADLYDISLDELVCRERRA